MSGVKLKCQFCTQTFESTYRFIPHVFMAHNKKIQKKLTKNKKLTLTCPCECDFVVEVHNFYKEGCSPDEAYNSLAEALVPLEEHLNTIHTKEDKIVVCWYCNIVVDKILWIHLNEHLSTVKNPTTPDKPKLNAGTVQNASSQEVKSIEAKPVEIKTKLAEVPTPEPITAKTNESPSKSIPEQNKPDVVEPQVVKVVEEGIGLSADKKGPAWSPDQERQRRPSSPMLTIAKAPVELAASTIPFSSFFQKKSFHIQGPKAKEAVKPPEPTVKPPEPVEKPPEPIEKPLASPTVKPPEPEEKPRRTSGEKAKISISEYTKKRQMSGDKPVINIPVSSQMFQMSKDIGLDAVTHGKMSGPAKFPEPIGVPEDKSKRMLDQRSPASEVTSELAVDPKISPRQEKVSGIGIIGGSGKKEPMRPPTPLDRPVTPTVTRSPDAGSSRSTTPGDRLSRPTTPLDWPVGSSRRQSAEGNPRRLSETYYKEKPRPVITEEMERQIIYGRAMPRRLNSVSPSQEKEKVSYSPEDPVTNVGSDVKEKKAVSDSYQDKDSISPEDKSKDSVSLKDTDKSKKSVSSESEVLAVETIDAEKEAEREKEKRQEKRKQEERDRLSRNEKLAAVRREIELRFQEEELKRMKDKETQKKRDEELREKIRIEEEKLKQERDKKADDKRKSKKRSKKKHKRKGKDSDTETADQDYDDAKRSRRESLDEQPDTQEPAHAQEEKKLQREESPDQYEQLKLNFLSQQKQALENEISLLEKHEKSRSVSPTDIKLIENQPEPVTKASYLPTATNPPACPEEEAMEVEDEEDDDDDLEAMMRRYKEEKVKERQEPQSSLSLLMDSYGGNKSQAREESTSPVGAEDVSIEIIDDEPDYGDQQNVPRGFDRDGRPLDEDLVRDEDEVGVPRGFDKDGHPLDGPKITHNPEDKALLKAASNAAMDIMAPAKKNRELKAASQLQCSLCKREGSSSSYYSAYQLLSHVFLQHRKKLMHRSRRVKGMTLSCPEGCGFITDMSKDGSSIDYFNLELPKHLEMLCEHIRDCHTGEPKMETCQFCSQPLKHSENWSWLHLANHRDSRRFYCDSCNNFPFKDEVHKCPGTGLETDFTADSIPDLYRKRKRSGEDVRTKSLEELAREVEMGAIDMANLVNRKNLGNLERYICEVCDDKCLPSLSKWLLHTRMEHLSRGHIKTSQRLKCFCCNWIPPRFERGREIIGINNLIQHLVTEHNSEKWSDSEFEAEKNTLAQIQRDMERRLEREREEACIQVPRLPAKCETCAVPIGSPKLWRYHVLAHRFGEVYCASCYTCILGHLYQEHSATCNEEDQKRVKVKTEKFRGDTWLDAEGKKIKVTYEHTESDGVRNVILAKTILTGLNAGRIVKGLGASQEEATAVLRDQIENIFTQQKLKSEEERKEEMEKEDKQKLVDLFNELAAVDKAAAELEYRLDVAGLELVVSTTFYYTRNGKCKIQASVLYKAAKYTALGDTRTEAVSNLSVKLREVTAASSEHRCGDCGSKFQKLTSFQRHQTIPCIQA